MVKSSRTDRAREDPSEAHVASAARTVQRQRKPGRPVAPRRRGLAPILASDARVLILGSFPSEASLAARQYYAHPRNHFWPILGAILGEPLAELPYAERLARVTAHRVAIWDTIVACERAGSLDVAIRNAEQGEIHRVRRVARELEAVCFNGSTAGRASAAWAHAGYATLVLPSTSPAYTLPIADKLARWRELGRFLEPR
jgi:TDG/mug DNA glycosylase family protein